MKARTLVIGEALTDVIVDLDGVTAEHGGGSPANVALGLARLGCPATLATHIGQDPRGRYIAQAMSRDEVALLPGSTGAPHTSTATVYLSPQGEATYDFDVAWEMPPAPSANGFHHLHTGSIAVTMEPGATDVGRLLKAVGDSLTVSYDINARPQLMGEASTVRETIEQTVEHCDIVKASADDIAWLYAGSSPEQGLREWAGMRPVIHVVTCGEDGVVASVCGEVVRVPARPVPVVDTLGAGDAFMAGLLATLLDEGVIGGARADLEAVRVDQVEAALRRAVVCAALTVAVPGANPPRKEDVDSAE